MISINKNKRFINKIIKKINSMEKRYDKNDLYKFDQTTASYFSNRNNNIVSKNDFYDLGINDMDDIKNNLFKDSEFLAEEKEKIIHYLRIIYKLNKNKKLKKDNKISSYVYEM